MGISIVASFVDISEAQVAAGALRSAGFHAMVMDQTFATMDWLAMQSLGGIRVGVPESEVDEAAAFLGAIIRDRPKRPARIQKGVGWRAVAILAGVVAPLLGLAMIRPQASWQAWVMAAGACGPLLAWLIVGAVKRRGRPSQVVPIVAVALAITAVSLIAAGIGLAGAARHELYPESAN